MMDGATRMRIKYRKAALKLKHIHKLRKEKKKLLTDKYGYATDGSATEAYSDSNFDNVVDNCCTTEDNESEWQYVDGYNVKHLSDVGVANLRHCMKQNEAKYIKMCEGGKQLPGKRVYYEYDNVDAKRRKMDSRLDGVYGHVDDRHCENNECKCSCHLPKKLLYAHHLFTEDRMLIPLIKILSKNNILDDFITLIQLLSSGMLDARNLPLLCALDRANLQKVDTTTRMTYFPETLEFWQVVRRTCRASGLLLFSGLKHAGQVSNNLCVRGKYDPETASVNFAVPHWQTLANNEISISKFIKPGLINDSFKLLNSKQQYILEFDAKSVSRGLQPNKIGDVDLWGFEGPPNLNDAHKQLTQEMQCIEKMNNSKLGVPQQQHQLQKILQHISCRIRDVRHLRRGHKMLKLRLSKMSETHPKNEGRFRNAIGTVKATIYQCDNWIRRALQCNLDICKMLSSLNNNDGLFVESTQVDFGSLPNVRILNDPAYIQHINLESNPQFIKQRTPLWHEMRKLSNITGSSCFRGIGLGTLKEQRHHFQQYVLDLAMPNLDPNTLQHLQHGIDNEINCITTICCRFMPALLPECALYTEDGCGFLDGDVVPKLMEISTDGVITHCKLKGCSHGYDDIVLECKCPYPKDDGITVHYDIPVYYACQLLAGMRLHNCKLCWYASYSSESMTLFSLMYSDHIWTKVWKLIKILFDKNKLQIPSKKHYMTNELKDVLRQYIRTHSTFLGEIPSMIGLEHVRFDDSYSDVYLQTIPVLCKPVLLSNVNNLQTLMLTAECVTEEAFELMRKKSTEILGFILTNSDRYKDGTSIAHIPVAYAMKGNSLSSNTLRNLLNVVRNKCKEEKISILCEVCDGQWMSLVVRDKKGYPLTRLQYQKTVWKDVTSMNKDQMLHYLSTFSKINKQHMDELSARKEVLTNGTLNIGNIQIQCHHVHTLLKGNVQYHKTYTILSRGGTQCNIPVLRYIRTIPKTICNTIWKIGKQFPSGIDDDEVAVTSTYVGTHQKHQTNMLQDILDELCKLNKKSLWSEITTQTLFHKYLQDAKIVNKYFVIPELHCINQVYKSYFNKKLFNSNDNKYVKVNKVVQEFGNTSKIGGHKRKFHNPPSLHALTHKILKSSLVPKLVIAVPVAYLKHMMEISNWEKSFTVPVHIPIYHRNIQFELYSYPEFNVERNQLEPRCLDATHILTNLRTHACKSGFEGVDKGAFLRASLADSKFLPRPIIEDLIDQQNAEYAKKVFSSKVEELMLQNGDSSEAKFVKVVREWYEACDERGLLPAERIDRMLEMHNYLTENRSFNTFPPPSSHVKGIPIVTYEGILQNISTRIILYALAIDNCYNNRSVSTLGIESFFADLSRIEFSQTGCPKSCHIPKIMSAVCELNNHKHNPEKGFVMDQRRGAPYFETNFDMRPPDTQSSMGNCSNFGVFNVHPFDFFQRQIQKRNKYKPNIALPNETERGKLTIRHLYRRNESKLTALQRLSLPNNFDNN